MTMDEFVQGLITGAPNLAVALLILFWQQRRINKYEDEKQQLVEHLLQQLAERQANDDDVMYPMTL